MNQCPECDSENIDLIFDWIDRRWLVCKDCGLQRWLH